METEVLVVGAGPTGLLLAGDLARAGIRVTVLERRAGESSLTRAFAVHARTLEQLDARGIADDVVATGTPLARLRLFGSAQVDLSRLATRFPFVLITPQYHVGHALAVRAESLGVQIRRRVEVTGLAQDDNRVTVTFTDGDGHAGTARAAYVVGADGHHSTVRPVVGLGFPGQAVVRSLVLADVRLTDPPPNVLTVAGTGAGFCFVVPYGDGWWRVITRDPAVDLPDDEPATLVEVRATARRVLGTDFGMHDCRWISRFHSEERQAPRYRVGRVFLAGDAAHVHSPAGGMGMNTGLQDAANLAWRLAAALRGRGPADVLDGYERERHPVGQLVLRVSGGLVRGALVRNPVARTARTGAIRSLLSFPPSRSRITGVLSGLGIGYGHPVGARVPDLADTSGRRLAEALRPGDFVLAAPEGVASQACVERFPVTGPRWTLVRPDGYTAATGTSIGEIPSALSAWGLHPTGPSIGVNR